jgi:ABC-2 type transport system ATP-binding protein
MPATLHYRAAPLLSARGVTKSFARGLARSVNRTRAIDDVWLDVSAGEVVALAGPEGAGKTTLLQCLAGLLRRDSGEIHFSCAVTGSESRPSVAYVAAVPVYYPFLTVRDVLELRASRLPSPVRARDAVERVLCSLDMRAEAGCRIAVLPPHVIARLSLAEALIGGPALMLVDFANTEAGSGYRRATFAALREVVGSTCAAVCAVRDALSVAASATRIAFMDEGRIRGAYTLERVLAPSDAQPSARPSLFVAEGMH